MSVEGPEARLSDAERQEALDALSEHVRTGRLDVDEFGDRSARVTAARTRAELEPLFVDLPQPRPAVLAAPAPARASEASAATPAPSRSKLGGVVLPVAALFGCLLLFTVARQWLIFVLPIAITVLAVVVLGRIVR